MRTVHALLHMHAEPYSLHAAIWLPRFALQAVLRVMDTPSRAPLALLDSEAGISATELQGTGLIMHANTVAEQLGVVAGMTPSQAMAQCSKLVLVHRMAHEEGRAHHDLMECATQWTPDYEATQPGLCVLDVSRVRGLRKQQLASGDGIRQWLAGRMLDARVGFASNPDRACLAAHATDSVLVLDGSEDDHELFQKLPVNVLDPPAPVLEVLRLWGVHTLAQLTALPREGVASRLGMEGLHLWQLAKGGTGRLLRLVRPAEAYLETVELEHQVESLEPLLFLLRRLVETLCHRLAERWLVAASEHIMLKFADSTIHERVLRVAEPTRNADLLLRVLHTHLDGLRTAAPIIAVTLELVPVRPSLRQHLLFERTLRDPQRFAETLDQLEALLGIGRVGKARLLPSRKPDAFTVAGFLEATHSAPTRDGGLTHGLPLCCFRPPRHVTVRLHEGRPAVMTTTNSTLTITQANGPCLLSGDWWDKQSWQREVWEVAASDGALYQLAREGPRWVLDGIFGRLPWPSSNSMPAVRSASCVPAALPTNSWPVPPTSG